MTLLHENLVFIKDGRVTYTAVEMVGCILIIWLFDQYFSTTSHMLPLGSLGTSKCPQGTQCWTHAGSMSIPTRDIAATRIQQCVLIGL